MAGDLFAERCGQLLTGGYDCVDRIVLSAYHPMGCQSGRVAHLVAAAARRQRR